MKKSHPRGCVHITAMALGYHCKFGTLPFNANYVRRIPNKQVASFMGRNKWFFKAVWYMYHDYMLYWVFIYLYYNSCKTTHIYIISNLTGARFTEAICIIAFFCNIAFLKTRSSVSFGGIKGMSYCNYFFHEFSCMWSI